MMERELFVAALHLRGGMRASFLAHACGLDESLRERVESMLIEHDRLGNFLQTSSVVPDDATASFDPNVTASHTPQNQEGGILPGLEQGSVIAGKYKLLEPIGEGGMGSVWLAQQTEPVKRKVAVKLIKPGMDSRQVLARFEAERQALAMMDHPNIAKVLDGGLTPDGRPFFVMELVKGLPITEYCDARKLTPKERLELFVPVSQAIQHAHQKGIIHRDIKPSNVLIALYDDKPVPKVIDFGVAKATGGALTEHSLNTGFGGVVGTPQYMSPEQATFNNLDIDTRSDVYSLGILLYELLAGSPPFSRQDLEKKGLLEILRVVREEEPPKPSTKLSTADALPSLSSNRGTEPKKLTALLRSELDWIVLKALEKDRMRRYETANAFAADVQRYLAGEAVLAHPPSRGYRLRKAYRKNRNAVWAVGVVLFALVLGIAGTTWGLFEARREAERARAEEQKVRVEEQKVRDEQVRTQAALDTAELNLVHSYLRPIGFKTNGVDQAELIALDELASQEDDRIKLLFIREALANGERALRVARRADRVVQAAVGSSLKRRAAVLELTGLTQRNKYADPRVRLAACWLAIELGSEDLPALSEGFETLLTMKVSDWENFIQQLPRRINRAKAIACSDALVAILIKTLDMEAFAAAAQALKVLKALTALAPLLDPAMAQIKLTLAANALVAVLGKTTDGYSVARAAEGLAELAPLLDPATAGKSFEALLAVLVKETDENVLATGGGLAALAPRLDPEAVKSALDVLLAVLSKTTDEHTLLVTANVLEALAPRLDSAQAKTAGDALVAILIKTLDMEAFAAAAQALTALAPRLDSATAKTAGDVLLAVLDKTTDRNALIAVGTGLAALAPRLDPAISKVKLTLAANAFVAVLGKSTDDIALDAAAQGLEALAPRLDSAAAKTTGDVLLVVLGKTKSGNALALAAARGLAALSPRLDPAAAKSTFDSLLAFLDKTPTHKIAFEKEAEGLAALAPRLDPEAVKSALDIRLAVLSKTTDEHTLVVTANVLEALAPRLDSAQARTAGDALVAILIKTLDKEAFEAAAKALTALAPRLDSGQAKAAGDVLLGALGKTTDGLTLDATATGFVALASRLNPTKCQEAIILLLTISRTSSTRWIPVSKLASLLSAINATQPLAELLHDPACLGEVKFAIILRLEELAFPQPAQAAVFAGLAATPSSPFVLPALKLADDQQRERNRRFRTVSDAAKWISEHHPEIDLDRPYHKIKPRE